MVPAAINDPFSPFGLARRAKLVLLGPTEHFSAWFHRARSLNVEHVSSAHLRREISRPDTVGDEATGLAHLRRWFFARKPDAGFVLADFPATLLQAKVFDEWLDARGESLDAVYAAPGSAGSLVAHYGRLGLLAGTFPVDPPQFCPTAGLPS
jgi:adenylate kinase